MGERIFEKPEDTCSQDTNLEATHNLILYNDDFNLYEHVIDSLVEVCKHNRLQAEQCTLIAHHNGKCDVKTGVIKNLKPLKDELIRRGLTVIIVSN